VVVQVVAPFVCSATPVTAACLSQGRFVNSTQDATIKDLSTGAGSIYSPDIMFDNICSLCNSFF
jgi:hypothetical protein